MKSKLIKSAFFITFATFLVKVLSIVYKIPYQNLTGDKGFYIYQQLYPLYSLIISMGTFGFPLAISENIKDNNQKKILSSTFFTLFSFTLSLAVIILFFNNPLGVLFNDPNLTILFLPLIPVLLLIPVVSVIRGYLYSNVNSINKVGISLIVEQFFRVGLILFLLYLYSYQIIIGEYLIGLYSLMAFGFGLLVSSIYLLFNTDYNNFKLKFIDYKVGLLIFRRGLFLLLSSSLLLLLQLVDSLTIIKVLSNVTDLERAMVIKGIYDRGLPLLQTVLFFVTPMLSSYLPHIKMREQYGKLLAFIVFLALPATIGMIFVLEDINILLFKDNQLTYTLQINSIIIFLYAIFLTLSSIMRDTKKVIYIISFGIVLKYGLNLLLIQLFGITGAPLSSIITITLINLYLLLNNSYVIVNKILLIKIILASFLMFLILYISSLFHVFDGLIVKIVLGLISYFVFSYLFKIKKRDLFII